MSESKSPSENRRIIKEAVRKVTSETRDKPAKVTCEHRENSPAHRRGAVDISSKDLSNKERESEANKISKELGKGYTVIVEEVDKDNRKQRNRSFRDGQKIKTSYGDIKATATHTHIQPDKNSMQKK